MKATLVRIGNSRGIRIPKPVIEQCGLENEVEIEIHEHEIIIRPSYSPRAEWDRAFKIMAERGDDKLLDPDVSISRWDGDDWQWK